MTNLLTLIVLIVFGYWVKEYLSRKQQQSNEKELEQKNRFIKEMQPLLHSPVSAAVSTSAGIPDIAAYTQFVSEYFVNQGYKVSSHARQEGIDLIGIREKELIMILCHAAEETLRTQNIKNFIADCTLHLEKNPMLSLRFLMRIIVVNRPINDPKLSAWLDTHSQSLKVLDLPLPNDSDRLI